MRGKNSLVKVITNHLLHAQCQKHLKKFCKGFSHIKYLILPKLYHSKFRIQKENPKLRHHHIINNEVRAISRKKKKDLCN